MWDRPAASGSRTKHNAFKMTFNLEQDHPFSDYPPRAVPLLDLVQTDEYSLTLLLSALMALRPAGLQAEKAGGRNVADGGMTVQASGGLIVEQNTLQTGQGPRAWHAAILARVPDDPLGYSPQPVARPGHAAVELVGPHGTN